MSWQELLVLDGTASLFRAYYGNRGPFLGPDGAEVGAMYGALQVMHGAIRKFRPRHVAVVFDAARHTFRNDLEPTYKANRGDPPEDLVPQLRFLPEVLRELGFAVFSQVGFEADDLMASLAARARREGLATRLMTVDKDLCQCVVDDHPPVRVEDPYTGRVMDCAGVRKRMGVAPEHVVAWQSLVGDSTDNVPGVRGVGPKAATALVNAFGTLDSIYDSLDRVAELPIRGSKTLGGKLDAQREAAFHTRKLVTLVPTVDLGVGDLGAHTTWRRPTEAARELFESRLGFRGPLLGLAQLYEDTHGGVVPEPDPLFEEPPQETTTGQQLLF